MLPQSSTDQIVDPIWNVVGIDPSLRNWGLAKGTLNLRTMELVLGKVAVVNPVLPTGKQVRQNSLDLESAKQLSIHTHQAVANAQAVFVEVPVGSQSARAMASYGICVGVLGSLRAAGIPFFEVTPNEVKLVSVGKKTATKQEMIDWAMRKHPEANWPTFTQKGETKVSEAKAEHMADATAAIHAGIQTNEFKQLASFYKETHANHHQAT